jgi:hypothetical protein
MFSFAGRETAVPQATLVICPSKNKTKTFSLKEWGLFFGEPIIRGMLI